MQSLKHINSANFEHEMLSFEDDYHLKISKHYGKEFALFQERLQSGLLDNDPKDKGKDKEQESSKQSKKIKIKPR